MIEATLGKPSEPGIYAARQWYGWRILEWYDGEWWHIGRQCAWPKKAEIDAFVGPLPVIARDFSVPEKDWPGSEVLEARGLEHAEMEEWEKYSGSAKKLADHIDAALLEKVAKEYDL